MRAYEGNIAPIYTSVFHMPNISITTYMTCIIAHIIDFVTFNHRHFHSDNTIVSDLSQPWALRSGYVTRTNAAPHALSFAANRSSAAFKASRSTVSFRGLKMTL